MYNQRQILDFLYSQKFIATKMLNESKDKLTLPRAICKQCKGDFGEIIKNDIRHHEAHIALIDATIDMILAK